MGPSLDKEAHYRSEEIDLIELPSPSNLAYVLFSCNGRGEETTSSLNWEMKSASGIDRVIISPAVRNFYQGHVFPSQSRLGYESSGLMIRPFVKLLQGHAQFQVRWSWRLGEGISKNDYGATFSLLGE